MGPVQWIPTEGQVSTVYTWGLFSGYLLKDRCQTVTVMGPLQWIPTEGQVSTVYTWGLFSIVVVVVNIIIVILIVIIAC